ncbi:phosphoribosylformylglycinamidine cyclo-ligase [Campylobacter sp. 19-13652]|uniref:phosphoribosylformylglycinamidine cyclo-ligase n=1 Tax=Campylobacter sp. 19-13652 TaxID=2840180 RepID=UPI001C73E160|nr:phosphoribosylformylglycinamidine cyclo-ligase [Campylobacter sp. 19-13652]BCX78632.1 phosphoribosylformylglycinamidine cyclo-ligase [Campylobacter sp. 19-13652]
MISYKDAGVDIDAGADLVERIKPHVKRTQTPLCIGGIGSFAGAIRIPAGYKNPAILGATDGVGTKLRLAIDTGLIDGVGQDLVAMCVNDLICNFATPIAFLDYYATAKLDVGVAQRVIAGIARGCEIAECALIGGETAEMPSMYHEGDFDLAGFAIGVAEEDEIDRSEHVKNGDLLVALPSSGLHSNGYSLARKVISKRALDITSESIDGVSLAKALLEPTKIYVKEFKKLKTHIHALAHITGGGIVENLPRILPDNLGAKVDKSAIKVPKIYSLFDGFVADEELYRTFNMGVGMVLVVPASSLSYVLENSDGYVIGEIIKGSGVKWA